MTCVNRDRNQHRSGRRRQAWMERIHILYQEVRQQPVPSVVRARAVLFDANGRTSARERMLLALIGHPDPEATDLLEHRALSFDVARLDFVHTIARRRHRRLQHRWRRQAA